MRMELIINKVRIVFVWMKYFYPTIKICEVWVCGDCFRVLHRRPELLPELICVINKDFIVEALHAFTADFEIEAGKGYYLFP